jgi:hypothetical protein
VAAPPAIAVDLTWWLVARAHGKRAGSCEQRKNCVSSP